MTDLLFSPDTQAEHQNKSSHGWSALWERMLRWGLGESILHIGTILAVIVLVLVVAWVMRRFYLNQPPTGTNQASAAPLEAATPTASPKPITAAGGEDTLRGITRLADMHTVLPARPRFDVSMYTVVAGDTLFGIAEKFGLKPETLMWGNSDILGDDPHRLTPGQQLRILPVDGAYYQWHTGDGLNGVAEYFDVSVDDILNWPGNNLSKESVGDYAAPNIKVDTAWLYPAVCVIMSPGLASASAVTTRQQPNCSDRAHAARYMAARWAQARLCGLLLRSGFPDTITRLQQTTSVLMSLARWVIQFSPPIRVWWFTQAGMMGATAMWL